MTNTLTVEQIHDLRARMNSPIDSADLSVLTAEIGELETLKNAIEARQAVLALEVDRAMRERAAAHGVPAARQGRGVAETVAAARRISPAQGRTLVAMARQLRAMPEVFARFTTGDLPEHKATIITREAGVLDPVDQRLLDAQVAAIEGLCELGARKLTHRVQAIALALDEDAVVRRRDKAVEDRHVSIRPTDRGDGMAWLTALIPVEQAAAIKAALDRAADVAINSGCATSRSQVRADTLVTRLLGDAGAVGLYQPSVPITVNVIMTDKALLNGNTDPATIAGAGPIPARLARRLIRIADTDGQKVELRRLFAHPHTGELVTMESKAREFPQALAAFIKLRDQLCRTPGCNATVAHIDHVDDWASGGPTAATNGQGLCRQCNWAKQVIGNQTSQPPPLATPSSHAHPRPRLVVGYDADFELAA